MSNQPVNLEVATTPPVIFKASKRYLITPLLIVYVLLGGIPEARAWNNKPPRFDHSAGPNRYIATFHHAAMRLPISA